MLEKQHVTTTFFTTAFYAERNHELLRTVSKSHEIASHSRIHTGFSETDPLSSKLTLEEIIQKPVNGFRMPRFDKIDRMNLKSAGYKYDSSVNPTFIPGRYNNIRTPRKVYIDDKSNLTEIPLSVSPVIRFPLFWLSFKNLPFSLYLTMCRKALRKDSYLHLCFHPWEFDNLERFRLPGYVKTLSGVPLLFRLERLITELQKTDGFTTISGFLNSAGLIRN
jgi:peptidoglycan/xylan/chitin deacetylase (PgdA/CDA1 family)